MAIINFDAGDVLKKKVIDSGWYKARLIIMNVKKAKESESINYWSTYRIEDGDFNGKEIEVCYNTATKGRSILGSAQFSSTSDILEIDCAINDIPIPAAGKQTDTDDLIGKQLDIMVTKESGDGAIFNGISAYMPYGRSAALASKTTF